MNELRRSFLRGGVSAATLIPLIGTGLLKPISVQAAEWHRTAFSAKTINDALKTYTTGPITETRDIVINAPEIAENGAKVSIEVVCHLPNARSLAVFADKNPLPLCATLEFSGNALPYARMELKVAESTRLRALVKTHDGKNHVAFREVKVTLGGCGG